MNKEKVKKILWDIFIKYQGLVILLVIIDQMSKLLVLKYLKPNPDGVEVFSWFKFQYAPNTGVAFSFLDNAPSFLTPLISLIAVAAIEVYVFYKKPKEKMFLIVILIILAGAIGNGIDRFLTLFNVYEGVVDFIYPTFFANFNIADIYVTLGCIVMLVYLIFSKEENEHLYKEKKEPTFKELKEAQERIDEEKKTQESENQLENTTNDVTEEDKEINERSNDEPLKKDENNE